MNVSNTAPKAAPPPPPPPPPPVPPPAPSPAKVADQKAQQLIDAHQQDQCAVSLPGVGGIGCHKDTDGVAVGRDIAAIAKTDPAQARMVLDKTQAKTPDAAERREVARGVVEGLSHEQARDLAASANGKATLDSARAELAADAGDKANQAAITRIDSALKAAELKNSAEFKNLDPATQKSALDQISQQQADPAAVDNTIALVKSPGFQAASPATRGELLSAQKQLAQDPIFREGLEKLAADPAFKKLTPDQQANAVRAFTEFAKSETYQGKEGSWFFNWGAKSVSDADKRAILDNVRQVVTSTGFTDVGADSQKAMLEALRSHATDAAFTGRLVKLVNDAGFIGLNDGNKEAKLLENYGKDDAFARGIDKLTADTTYSGLDAAQKARVLGDMTRLADTEAFKKSNAADKQAMIELVADISAKNPANPALMDKVFGLVGSKDFQSLDGAAKTAVLSQVRNYPDSKVVDNLERMIGKDWFKDFDAGDKQRALKLIAYMSYPRTGVDQKIIDNTLEKFLADDAPYKLELKSITAKPGNITFGYAADGVMTINEDLVAANNDKLETDSYGRKLSLDTVPHEINHLINGDKVAETFDYLNEEYRAWYVGFSADHGRPPSNQEALERWAYFLDPNSGYYDSASKGALANKDEAAKIFDQLSKLTGLTVDASNYQKVIADLAADPTKYKTDPNAAGVVPPGNLDNH
jgi:hypothetical protein